MIGTIQFYYLVFMAVSQIFFTRKVETVVIISEIRVSYPKSSTKIVDVKSFRKYCMFMPMVAQLMGSNIESNEIQ